MNTNEPTEDEDTDGLAGERTDLAWSRSGLAALAAVAAVIKRLVGVDDLKAATWVLLIIAGGLVAWALALGHARTLMAPALAGRGHADPEKLRYVAFGTAALGVGALILALMPD